MLKLSTSFSKKVPVPGQEFSSQSYHAAVELELSDKLQPHELQGQIHATFDMVRQAVEMVRQLAPELIVDGEMQANTALNADILNGTYPFNRFQQPANVLIFPSMEAANIAYKLVQQLANADVIGPILVGMRKPVHIMQRGDEVKDIVNLAALAVVKAQRQE